MARLSDIFDPNVERLSILPRPAGSLPSEGRGSVLGKGVNYKDWVAPQMLVDIVKAIETPYRALQGEEISPQEALNVATNVAGGGFAASRGAPANALGMFIGPKSSAWNKANYEKAVEMEKAGARPADIWRETMTARGLDQKWRQEIPDTGATLDMSKIPQLPSRIDIANQFLFQRGFVPKEKVGYVGVGSSENLVPAAAQKQALDYADNYLLGMEPQSIRLTSAFQHNALEEAYPNLVNNLKLAQETRSNVRGSFDELAKKVTTGGATDITQNPLQKANAARSTLLHEIQHAIQKTENFGRGGSPESAKLIAQAQIKSELAPLAVPYATNRKYWDDYGAAARSEYMVRLGDIATRDNIKPRIVYGLQDWYKYGNDYRREAGPQPKKPGAARDEWFRGAAQFIQDRNISSDAKYQNLPYNNLRDAKNAQKRAMTQIKKTDEATQEYLKLGAKQKRFDELSDVEAYKRLAGEAESRLTQTREKLSMEERRANFPFTEQYTKPVYGTSANPAPYGTKEIVNPYGLDVPAKETVAYTQFGDAFGDPLMQFIGRKPTQDPLEMFIGLPKSR
jgi:hypothetical protein